MPNRYLCTVLDEMRACYKTRNFAPILGLIEEVQSLGNRMESAIEDLNDIPTFAKKRSELRHELKELRAKRDAHLAIWERVEKELNADQETESEK